MRAFGVARSRCLRAAAAASANVPSCSSSSSVAWTPRNSGLLLRSRASALTTVHVHAPLLALPGGARALSSGAFVSSHYQLEDPHEVPEFLERKGLPFRATDTHLIVKECPFCHPTRGRSDNLFKLYVHRAKGVYKCHRCGAAGSWFDFKQKLQTNVSVGSAGGLLGHGGDSGASVVAETKVISVLDNAKAMAIQRNLLDDPEFASVRAYLTDVRGLEERVLTKYGVGAIEQPFRGEDGQQVVAKCISFPWMARQEDMDAMGVLRSHASPASQDKNQFDVIRLKLRGLENKAQQRLVPKGGSWGLFGWNTVPTAAEEIVVTEGEFDAMAVYQATGLPAVSLPNGCQSLPPNVLPLLERFKKIYLWLDNDAAGQANVEKFATKLGIARSFIVRAPMDPNGAHIKDANDALLAGVDMKKLIARAEIIPHSQIATFEQLRRDVYEEIVNPIRACGVQSRTLPSLNRLLKGHRPGEVTILTGPTGCGKTTLLSQLSLDLCGQGVNTLWGSFEIKNTRLIQKMLTQLAGKNLRGDVNAFEVVADKFEALPMYFLRFFGSTDVDEVLDAMEYAVYAYDVQHILLDNVQFMMAGQGRGYDKFERQDQALDKFRKFATQKNVHLTLVIHPRKEQEDVDLTLTSVFGTAKATQEADNVLILQRTKGQNKLDVRKNRFDGTLGSIPLMFDGDSNSLKEYGEHTMDENVASIHLEAEMRLEQKMRQQKMERAAAANTDATTTSESQDHGRLAIRSDDEPEAIEPPRRFEYSNEFEEFNDGVEGNARMLYSLQAADRATPASKLNGQLAVNGAVNGLNGLNGLHHPIIAPNGANDKPSSSSGSSGSPVGSPSRGPNGVNGVPRSGPSARGGGPSTEPFSSFTPIITR